MSQGERSFRSQVLRNTASSAVANGWSMVIALVTLPLLLQGLGREAFGVWVLIATFSAVNGWFSFADLGTTISTTRRVAAAAAEDQGEQVRRVCAASLAAAGSMGALSALALGAVGPLVLPPLFGVEGSLRSAMQASLVVFAAQVLVDLVVNSVQAGLDGVNRVDLARLVEIVRRTAVGAATAAAALATNSLVWTAIGSAAATMLTLGTGLLLLRRLVGSFAELPPRSLVVELFRAGRAAAVLRPLGVVQRTMDRLIVGIVLGPSSVALVEVARQVQAVADAVLSSSSLAVVPASSWLDHLGRRSGLGELAERGTKYAVLATAPVVVGVAMLSGPLVQVWLGAEFAEAAGLATVAVLNVGLAAPLAVGSQMLLGTGRAGTIARAAGVALVLNLAASIVLVNVVGIVGVFIATLLAAVLLVPLLGVPVLRVAELSAQEFVTAAIAPVAVPAAAQIAVIAVVLAQDWSAWPTLVVGGVTGAAVYVLAMLRFAAPPSELRALIAGVRGA